MGLASVVGCSASGTWLIARYGTDDQRRRYLADLAAGRRISGIALTEPDTGSDLKAITLHRSPDDDHYVVSGTKTMITQAATPTRWSCSPSPTRGDAARIAA